MNRQIAELLLGQEMAKARAMGYHKLRDLIDGEPIINEITGPDGKCYQLEVCVFWDNAKNGPIKLIGAVDDGGLRAFFPLSAGDLVYPDSEELP